MPLPLIASLLLPGIGMAARGAGAIASGVGRASAFGAGGNPYAPSPDQQAPAGKMKKISDVVLGRPKTLKNVAGKGLGIAGVSLSLSSLLRQSQLFTGTIGALFQVVGGFIDVILAPFMPYFAKAIGKLGTYIPVVQEYAVKVHDWLAKNVFPFLSKIFGTYGNFLKGLWDFTKTSIFPIIEAYWKYVKMFVSNVHVPIFKKIFEGINWIWQKGGTQVVSSIQWVLAYIPKAIEGVTKFMESLFSFQWLKTAVSKVLEFFSKIVNGIAGADLGILGSPFGFLKGLGDKLDATITSMNYPSYRENQARQQQINISVSTNVNGGSNPFDTQLSFDSANKESINQSKRTDVSLDSNALEPFWVSE